MEIIIFGLCLTFQQQRCSQREIYLVSWLEGGPVLNLATPTQNIDDWWPEAVVEPNIQNIGNSHQVIDGGSPG